MKVKVIRKFKDKNTNKVYKAGDVIEVTKKRYAEIQKVADLLAVVTNESASDDTAETE